MKLCIMKLIAVILMCAINEIYAKNNRHVKIPSPRLFKGVIKESRTGLRAPNAEEAVIIIEQLLKDMQKHHELIPIREDAAGHYKGTLPIQQNNDRTRSKRNKRSPTQAGYTHDHDTCQIYNDNLQKLWSQVAMFFTTSDVPSKAALHNIAIIVQAYLDHQHNKNRISNAKSIPDDVDDKDDDPIADIISNIQNVLTSDPTNPVETMYAIISKELKPNSDVNKDCYNLNEEYLRTSIDLAYQNYVENAMCSKSENSSSLRQNKADADYIIISNKTSKKRGNVKGGTNVKVKKNIIDQSVEIQSKLGTNSETRKIEKPNKMIADLYGEYVDERTPDSYQRFSLDKFAKHNLLSRKINDCRQAVRRKFINTIRVVIKRFMNRYECEVDATLRSSNANSFKSSQFHDLNKDHKTSDSKYQYSILSSFKVPGKNIFAKLRANTEEHYKNPMDKLYESGYNNDDLQNYEVNPSGKYQIFMNNEFDLAKASDFDTSYLSNGKINSHDHAYSNQHRNDLYVRPTDVNHGTTQNHSIKSANLSELFYEDLLKRHPQDENDEDIKDKFVESLKFSKHNDKVTSKYYDDHLQNKRLKKISKRSINSRSRTKLISADKFNSADNEIQIINALKHYPDSATNVFIDNGKIKTSIDIQNGATKILDNTIVLAINNPSFVRDKLVFNNHNGNVYLSNSQHSHNTVHVKFKS